MLRQPDVVACHQQSSAIFVPPGATRSRSRAGLFSGAPPPPASPPFLGSPAASLCRPPDVVALASSLCLRVLGV